MIYAIAYGNEKFKDARDFNLRTAVKRGKVDKTIAFGPLDIDRNFFEKNKDILNLNRGNGYWLWKPYFIYKTLCKINESDYLIYADSGCAYIRNVQLLINVMEKSKQDIMCFDVGTLEKKWTKREIFISLNCDCPDITDSTQRMATIIILKNNDNSRKIVSEWLEFCQKRNLITDELDNTIEQYPEFSENRHDQSIWSVVTKKNNIPAFRDPTQWGNNKCNKELLNCSYYPTVFWHHRGGNVDNWVSVVRRVIGSKYYGKNGLYDFLYKSEGKIYRKIKSFMK